MPARSTTRGSMKRLLLVFAGVGMAVALAASPASAATKCSGSAWGDTAGGYSIRDHRDPALMEPHEASEVYRQMNCASVRYAVRAVHRKVRKQRGWPHVPRMFWDGYVTWDCSKTSRLDLACVEYDSYTGFRFRARVY